MDCPRCGAFNPDDAHWCSQCLAPFVAGDDSPSTSDAPVSTRRELELQLVPTRIRWSLHYLNAAGGDAGHAEVTEDRGFASASTAWGGFTLQTYDGGDEGSYDLFTDANERVATFICDEGGPSFTYTIRDESAAPAIVISHLGGLIQRMRGDFDVTRVNRLKLGQIKRRKSALRTSEETTIYCARHEVSVGFEGRQPIDPLALVAAPLVMAIHAGDPHREVSDDDSGSANPLDFLDYK